MSARAPYLQPNGVLRNKLGIQDGHELLDYEKNFAATRYIDLKKQTFREFNLSTLRKIHYELFQDVYDWAGKFRTVDIAKKGTVFCHCPYLEEQGADIFKRLKKDNNLQGLDAERFCEKAADLYCDLNMLHPFREGNGRTQHMLIYQVAKNAGYELDMANVDREKLMARAILGAVDSRFMEGLMRETIKEMPKEKYPKRKVLVKGRMDEDKSKGRE